MVTLNPLCAIAVLVTRAGRRLVKLVNTQAEIPPTLPSLGRNDPNNGLRQILEASERVQSSIDETLGDQVDGLYLLVGILPNATRRLMTELETPTAGSECVIFHTPRICNHIVAAFILLRQGMIVDAVTAVRSALETTAQAIVLMENESLAESWLKGKTFRPEEIGRKLKERGKALRPLYEALSDVAHANPAATWAYSVPSSGTYAIGYGGSYRPKQAAQLLALLFQVALLYLTEFYQHYQTRLNLVAWPLCIETGHLLHQSLTTWIAGLPDDFELLAEEAKNWKPSPMEQAVPPEHRNAVLRVAEHMRDDRLRSMSPKETTPEADPPHPSGL